MKFCNFCSILSLLWLYSILWLTCAKFVIEKNNFLCHFRWVDDKRNVLPFLSFEKSRAKPKISEIRLPTTMWSTMRFHMIFMFFFATRNYASKIFGIYVFFNLMQIKVFTYDHMFKYVSQKWPMLHLFHPTISADMTHAEVHHSGFRPHAIHQSRSDQLQRNLICSVNFAYFNLYFKWK